jgi:hypothetical protein
VAIRRDQKLGGSYLDLQRIKRLNSEKRLSFKNVVLRGVPSNQDIPIVDATPSETSTPTRTNTNTSSPTNTGL